MLKKLPFALMILLGTGIAQEAQPLSQLQGSSRILMVFAPDTNSANFKRQLQMIEHHSFELSSRNTVVVPVSSGGDLAAQVFGGEMLPLSGNAELSYARTRFHIQSSEFAVLLLNEDGAETLRSKKPVDIYELTAKLDTMPQR